MSREMELDLSVLRLVPEQLRVQKARVNGRFSRIPVVLQFPCTKLDPINWLSWHQEFPVAYWSSRDGCLELAALGKALEFSSNSLAGINERYSYLEKYLELFGRDQQLFFLGGVRFAPSNDSSVEWQEFPAFWFFLPEVLLLRQKEDYRILVTLMLKGEESDEEIKNLLLRILERLKFQGPEVVARSYDIRYREDAPDILRWSFNLRRLLMAMNEEGIEKVVLARKSSFYLGEKVDAFSVLRALSDRNQHTYNFLFRAGSNGSFLGSTPERLFRLRDGVIESEAVAGTSFENTATGIQPGLNGQLLRNEKNLFEQRVVVEDLQERFAVLCSEYRVDQSPSLLELSNVKHLRSRLSGRLKEGVTLTDIFHQLHPTPAVGGRPREDALRLIKRHEPFDRGWYAGPVGVISRGYTEMAVAIRSCLLNSHVIHLYAGAGIVSGSQPLEEWRELESKIAIPLKIFKSHR